MIGQRFSAAAETYDRHARPQKALAQSVISVLPEMYPEQILELGSGTGQLTRLLTQRFPDVLIDAVDVAEKMIEHSRAKFSNYPHINWIVDDAQSCRANAPYSLIVSSSALHWVVDLRETFANIFQCLEPGGTFALGMMLSGTLKALVAVEDQAEEVERLNRSLEERVRDRTRELRDRNRDLELEVDRRMRIQGELRNAKEHAEAADHAKSEFLGFEVFRHLEVEPQQSPLVDQLFTSLRNPASHHRLFR